MSRPLIALEMERLRYPHSGLGQFCSHLSDALYALDGPFDYQAYAPIEAVAEHQRAAFAPWRQWHRFLRVPTHAALWHYFHQGSNYHPRARCKRVMTLHDLNFIYRLRGDKRARRIEQMQRKLAGLDGLVYISEFTRDCAKRHLNVAHIQHQAVIYNGLCIDYSAAAERPGFVDDNPYLFSLGIVGEKKNFHTLVPMMRYLPDLKLIIAGPNHGAYAQSIRDQVEAEGLSERVVLCGPISEAQKRWLYLNCRAFVFPSMAEGFGLPLIEALAAAKPTVVSTYTALPEIGGDSVWYFEDFEPLTMAQTVLAALDGFDAHKAQGAKARAARFNWHDAALRHRDFYEQVLA